MEGSQEVGRILVHGDELVPAGLEDVLAQVALAEQGVRGDDPPRQHHPPERRQGHLVLVRLLADLRLGERQAAPLRHGQEGMALWCGVMPPRAVWPSRATGSSPPAPFHASGSPAEQSSAQRDNAASNPVGGLAKRSFRNAPHWGGLRVKPRSWISPISWSWTPCAIGWKPRAAAEDLGGSHRSQHRTEGVTPPVCGAGIGDIAEVVQEAGGLGNGHRCGPSRGRIPLAMSLPTPPTLEQ